MVEVGFVGCNKMGAIATASTPVAPRVLREAASHVLSSPFGSSHCIFWNSIHFASLGGKGVIDFMLGGALDMVRNCVVKTYYLSISAASGFNKLEREPTKLRNSVETKTQKLDESHTARRLGHDDEKTGASLANSTPVKVM